MLMFAGLAFGGVLFSQVQRNGAPVEKPQSTSQTPDQTPPSATPAGSGEKTPVDIMASKIYNDQALLRSLGIDEKAQIFVGEVAFHHNGTIIACDSAVRYYATNRIDCFRNVIINKDSTYVYGERAEYNGNGNLATVFSPVVKVTDGDATLYTTDRFTFNTATNTGRWNGGGVVYQQDNEMESERGYFYSDLHELVAVRNVQMRNSSHEMISDSVRYNSETRIATFYTRTYIWTSDGEIISARRGRYNTRDSTYFFHDNAYVLDRFRESWADTIDFNARVKDGIFYGNVQIDDNEHDSSAFGDFGQYWGARGETMLTRRPSLLNYDADQGNSDTLYMRADTIRMWVRYPSDSWERDSLGRFVGRGSEVVMDERPGFSDSLAGEPLSDSMRLADSLAMLRSDSLERLRLDSVALVARTDSLARIDSIRTANPKAYRLLQKAETKRIKAEKKRLAAEAREAKYAAKAAAREERGRLRAERRAARAAEKAAAREAKIAARRRTARRLPVGGLLDSLARRDSLSEADSLRLSGYVSQIDSLRRLDSLVPFDSLPPSADTSVKAPEPDTTFRIFRGWHNVRIFRRDMQAVSDSMVGFSVDSTIHMYIDPILWHADSQITADSIVLYTAKQQIEHAEFFGNPIMGSQVGGPGSRQFNQVRGRHMVSWFRDGELHRHDVNENAQSLYYIQDEEQLEDGTTEMTAPHTFVVQSSANISFFFESDSLRYIVPRKTVAYTAYPMNQIPGTQPTRLQGFVWRVERKPALTDVFDRYVRPSEREFYEGLPHPAFPIAARILRRREYLIENRMWTDRTDPLPAYATERWRRLGTPSAY
jgi:hypothetical protein